MACAKDADAVMVSPATTARIVAKATAEMTPSSSVPPSSYPSSGAAESAAPGAAASRPRRARGGGDRREGARGDAAGQQVPAELVRQQRRGRVGRTGCGGDPLRADERGS